MFINYNGYKKKKTCPHAQKERPTWIVINGEVGNKRYKKKEIIIAGYVYMSLN